jgi:hypothetical protein
MDRYDKQDQQGKAAFNERNPHTTQQQYPVLESASYRPFPLSPAYAELKPSRQHFQFCCFRLSLGILIFSISTFKHENGEILNLKTSADVIIRRLSLKILEQSDPSEALQSQQNYKRIADSV